MSGQPTPVLVAALMLGAFMLARHGDFDDEDDDG